MPTVRFSILQDLHDNMKSRSEIKWSEVVKKSISEKIEELDLIDRIKNNRLTKEDVDLILEKSFSKTQKEKSNTISDKRLNTIQNSSDSMDGFAFLWKEKERLLKQYNCNDMAEVIQLLQKKIDEQEKSGK